MDNASPFLIYGSILTFFLPLAIMTFTAIRSIQLIKRQSTNSGNLRRRSMFDPNAQPHPEEDEEEEDEEEDEGEDEEAEEKEAEEEEESPGKERKSSLDPDNEALSRKRSGQIRFAPGSLPLPSNGDCPTRYSSQDVASPLPNDVSPRPQTPEHSIRRMRSMSVPVAVNHMRNARRPSPALSCRSRTDSQGQNSSNSRENATSKQRYRRRLTLIFTGHRSSVFSVHSKEQRAIRTLLMVFIVFAVCWSPFFILQMIVAFLPPREVFNEILFDLAWPGYASSGLNPVIYTIFNPEYKVSVTALLSDIYQMCHKRRRL